MRKRIDTDLEAWVRSASEALMASASDGIDLEDALQRVHRRAAELIALHAAASTEAGGMRLSGAAARIGRLFRENPDTWLDDLTIYESTHVMPGTSFPVIRQFVDAGWLEERWEDGVADGESRRRFYRMTSRGATEVALAIAQWELNRSTEKGTHGIRKPRQA